MRGVSILFPRHKYDGSAAIHVFFAKSSSTRFCYWILPSHQIRQDTDNQFHAVCRFILFNYLFQFVHPTWHTKSPNKQVYQDLLLDLSIPPGTLRHGEIGSVRDQLRLFQALQGVEGSLEPSLQAGTLFSASPFPATASGHKAAGW